MRLSLIAFAAISYLASLFAVAWWADRRAEAGRSLIRNPLVYTLSIAVYCTSWTFYGAVGTAARNGPEFLPIYLGPTIAFLGWWLVLRRIVRIGHRHRITSIADFLSSRYGKAGHLSAVVTVIAAVGAMPYIALQLKAVSVSTAVLLGPRPAGLHGPIGDTGFWVALGMALFAILFGTRHIDAAERHEGVVAAVAFESAVKLVAFVAVGLFVLFGLFAGPADLLAQAARLPNLAEITTLTGTGPARWSTVLLLSICAAVCLPRQFQLTIVENTDERHLWTASWLFPLYLVVISLFVLPIALAGLLLLPGADADGFVLTLPLSQGRPGLALVAFLGGLSSATAMVIVESITLSTMLCNDLVVPALLRARRLRLAERGDLTGLLLGIRRLCILAVVLLGYAYYRLADQTEALATIGLVSFAAAAQLAPAMLTGLFWKQATAAGAQAGLVCGFILWAYTLLLPSLARSGLLPPDLIVHGPFGWWLLRPEALFGLEGIEPLTHALFWSWLGNAAALLTVSVFTRPGPLERIQAGQFVGVMDTAPPGPVMLARTATVADLHALARRFIGPDRAYRVFQDYAAGHGGSIRRMQAAPADLVHITEQLLSGTIGAASARVMIGTVARGEMLNLADMMDMLEETSQVIEYSQQLQHKSVELERTTDELRAANARLHELDRLKDEFLSTVSHELRTPLTAIRSATEILADHRDVPPLEARRFLAIILSETARLTRLIDQTLDFALLASGEAHWRIAPLDAAKVVQDAADVVDPLACEKHVHITLDVAPAWVAADRDRLLQVFVNLLSNGVKFVPATTGHVAVRAVSIAGAWSVDIADNGPGVAEAERERIFERFIQSPGDGRRTGTGLGLAISRRIVEHFGGRISAEAPAADGALFRVQLPTLPGRPTPDNP